MTTMNNTTNDAMLNPPTENPMICEFGGSTCVKKRNTEHTHLFQINTLAR